MEPYTDLPTIRKKHRTDTERARECHGLCPAFESFNSTAMTLPDAPVGNTPPWAWASIPIQCKGRRLTVDAQDHGGVFGQQTENQNMRMASTTKSDKTIGGHAHFLALSLLAFFSNRRYTNNVTLYAGVLARCAPIQIYKVAPTVPLTSAAYSLAHDR